MVIGIVLAGGYGTRMRPLTDGFPKHLLPIGPEPLVGYQLRRLAAVGVTEVVLATGYCAEQFEPALGDGSAWGVRLRFAAEAAPLGTAGALRHAWAALPAPLADQPLVVLNGDLLSAHDLSAQHAGFLAAGAAVSLHVRTVPDARAYGSVATRSDGTVTAFVEKSPDPVGDLINAGTYVVDPAVVATIPDGRAVSWEREVLPDLVVTGRVQAYAEQAYFRDVGSPTALVAASADVVLGRLDDTSAGSSWWSAAGAQVDPRAVLDRGTAVHESASVRAGARVSGSIVMRGAEVKAGAVVVDTVLAPGAVVDPGVVVRGGVITPPAG